MIYYYADALDQPGTIDDRRPPEWELFDLEQDPYELNNVYHNSAYTEIKQQLENELHQLQMEVGDQPYPNELN